MLVCAGDGCRSRLRRRITQHPGHHCSTDGVVDGAGGRKEAGWDGRKDARKSYMKVRCQDEQDEQDALMEESLPKHSFEVIFSVLNDARLDLVACYRSGMIGEG